jgi:gas vesicle protein
MMAKESKFLTGIVIGAIVGAVAGVLLAVESGEETRKKIAGKTSELKEDLDAKLKDVSEKIKNLENEDLSGFKDVFYDVKGKIKDQYAHLSDKVETIEKDISSKYKELEKEAEEKLATTKNT